MAAADWTTLARVQVGSSIQCRLGLLPIAWFIYFSDRKWSILPIIQQSAQFSCYFAQFKATSGVLTSIFKNAHIRLKLQKNVVSSKILLGPNLHCLGDPTCTQATVNQSAVTICGCRQQLPGTQQVQSSLLTRGGKADTKHNLSYNS